MVTCSLHVNEFKKRTFTSVIFYCQNFANFDYPEDKATERPRWVYYVYTPSRRGYTLIISLGVGVVLLVPDNRQCEGLDSGISGIDSHVFFYGLCLTVAIIFS